MNTLHVLVTGVELYYIRFWTRLVQNRVVGARSDVDFVVHVASNVNEAIELAISHPEIEAVFFLGYLNDGNESPDPFGLCLVLQERLKERLPSAAMFADTSDSTTNEMLVRAGCRKLDANESLADWLIAELIRRRELVKQVPSSD